MLLVVLKDQPQDQERHSASLLILAQAFPPNLASLGFAFLNPTYLREGGFLEWQMQRMPSSNSRVIASSKKNHLLCEPFYKIDKHHAGDALNNRLQQVQKNQEHDRLLFFG